MVGRNLRMDFRWAAADADHARSYAAELVALAPDVILASSGSVVGPLRRLTRTIPIVSTETSVSIDRIAFGPPPARARLQDIELARISLEIRSALALLRALRAPVAMSLSRRGAIGGRPRRLPSLLGPREPSADSFCNHRPLELSNHAHHLKTAPCRQASW